ncbi:MAG: class I SAM-dependent methyltransferase, partial [Phycisphaerales bacterium]
IRNESESGSRTEHICIEPFENPWLEKLGVRVIRQRVESVDLGLFESLRENDLLFIDSSHVIRPQGDVLFEYQSIVPRLARGVYVHVHDMFTPRDYPHGWVIDQIMLWNEQYIVEVLLSSSSRYEVVAALNYLKHSHYDALCAVCPYLEPSSEPGAFYFRVK